MSEIVGRGAIATMLVDGLIVKDGEHCSVGVMITPVRGGQTALDWVRRMVAELARRERKRWRRYQRQKRKQ